MDDEILHQDDVEQVIDEELAEQIKTVLASLSTHAAIADPGTPSAAYVEAEAVATNNAVKGILAVLRDAGLIPAS